MHATSTLPPRQPAGEACAETGEAEGEGERLNRELIELLNELRVALTGVQVLLAFLLTVPFSSRFDQLSASDRRVYFVAVMAAAAASACLIAPSAHHRMRFRDKAKLRIVRVGNTCAIAGLIFIVIAVAASVYLVADILYSSALAAVVGGGLAAFTVLLWFGAPLLFSDGRDERAR